MDRLSHVENFLADVGYQAPRGSIVTEYGFTTEHGDKRYADLVAFSSTSVKDITTACIAVKIFDNGWDIRSNLHDFRYLGTPIVLVAQPKNLEFWSVSTPNSKYTTQKFDQIIYSELFAFDRRSQLSPEILQSAKMGSQQYSLFALDPSLWKYAQTTTKKALVNSFSTAYKNSIGELTGYTQKLAAFDRLSIAILASAILQDKLTLDEFETSDVIKLLKAVKNEYKNYFAYVEEDTKILNNDHLLQSFYLALRQDYTFRNLTNDILSHFYENSLLKVKSQDRNLTKELGIFYTPQFLSELILRYLPIEHLPQEQRTVYDGTCGSGNLLLAAYDRLNDALPKNTPPRDRHSYLNKHILGTDLDEFACEVARLSLLNQSIPFGDSWQVFSKDISEDGYHPERLFGVTPNIIVGNPPFSGNVKSGQKRTEIAAEIVRKYIDWLPTNGLLGIILPASFLHGSRGNVPEVRRILLNQFDLLEVWKLPPRIFHSDAPTTIILAQKRKQRTWVRTRIVENYDKSYFETEQNATYVSLADQNDWDSHPLDFISVSHLAHIWNQIDSFPKITQFCSLHWGVNLSKSNYRTHLSNTRHDSKWRKVLRSNKGGNTLEPYVIHWDQQPDDIPCKYIKYPSDDLLREGNPKLYEAPQKLILNSQRKASSPWRIIAAADYSRLIITRGFYFAIPLAGYSIEVLEGIFNSSLCNAWFASHCYIKDIKLDILENMPVPTLSASQQELIQKSVNAIKSLKQQSIRDSEKIREQSIRIDEILFNAAGLEQDEQEIITQWLNYHHKRPGPEWNDWFSNAPLPTRYESPPPWEHYWLIEGEVKDVTSSELIVELEGFEVDERIPLTRTIPGWMLRVGTEFEARIPWTQRSEKDIRKINWLSFSPVDYSYMSMSDLETELLDKSI